MHDAQKKDKFAIGRTLARVREEAGLTQAQLAGKVTCSPAGISRIESGDKAVTPEELDTILKAIGTVKARQLGEFTKQRWDVLERPDFDHPNRDSLWSANATLRKLRKLRENPQLKNVFVRQIDLYEKEIRRLVGFLQPCAHQIAFIGSIGVGKSTAICKLAGLLKPGEAKLEREIVLDTGAGGTTICQVHINRGPQYGLRIEPRTEVSIRRDVEDFAEYLLYLTRGVSSVPRADGAEDESPGVSKEVERAIRNMSGLVEKKHKDEAGKSIRIDPARELATKFTRIDELTIEILTKMELVRRGKRDAWYPEDCGKHPMQWLQKVFADVNNGRSPDFTLPQKIEVLIPEPVFSKSDYIFEIIDTRGISQDAYAARQDLESHFDDPRTLVVLCSTFLQAPEANVQTLLRRAKEAGLKDVESKTIVLVLPHDDEALKVKDNAGSLVETVEEGYELKAESVNLALAQMGFGQTTVLFFNSKQDSAEPVLGAILAKVTELRRIYSARIIQLVQAVDLVIENQENEEVRLVFEEVRRHLSTWVESHRELGWDGLDVQEPLITAIDNTRYAATVWAAVRRYGDWSNLDYYHHLGFGARRIAVGVIGS
jgi:transcriptional regulator with XRE-family HTH domain